MLTRSAFSCLGLGDGDSFSDDQHHHHHHQAPPQTGGSQDDVRPSHQFSGYGGYQSGAPSGSSSMPSIHDTLHHGSGHHSSGSGAITARRHSRADAEEPDDLFPDIPEAKKRKFILVEDSDRQSRLRVRVTLDGVDTREIPDSFRKNSSVYPRSYFPREMQSPPPSATGSKFFQDDLSDDPGAEDDGTTDTEGRRAARGARAKAMVRVPMVDGSEGEVAIPRMRRGFRGKEVRLNDLGYRMAWLQSRVFAGRTIFLQRACKFLRESRIYRYSHRRSSNSWLTRFDSTRQWTATATRRGLLSSPSCRTSRRSARTLRLALASGSGTSGCVAVRRKTTPSLLEKSATQPCVTAPMDSALAEPHLHF